MKARRYRREQWLWNLQIPVACLVYVFEKPLWDQTSILYLAIVSIYALSSTAGAKVEAATPNEDEEEAQH